MINFAYASLCPNSKLRKWILGELCDASRPLLFYFYIWFECYFKVESKEKLCLTDLGVAGIVTSTHNQMMAILKSFH